MFPRKLSGFGATDHLSNDMKVGILGSGLMGGKLGTLFARVGHDVVFSYARSERKLKRLAREAQGSARAGAPAAAALRRAVRTLADMPDEGPSSRCFDFATVVI